MVLDAYLIHVTPALAIAEDFLSEVMYGLCCPALRAGGGGRSWIWLAIALWLASGAGGVRTNVVAEVPQLDLGE